jgi:hypothetical protein
MRDRHRRAAMVFVLFAACSSAAGGGAGGTGGAGDGQGCANYDASSIQASTGTWTSMTTPWSAISPSGPLSGTTQAAVTSDGTHNILVTANWNGGLWRYVEPLD